MIDKRLLVVDDDLQYRQSVIIVFKKYFRVDYCGSLESALRLIQNNNYDLVITDGAFPETGDHELKNPDNSDYRGSQVADAARKRGMKVIGITSEPNKLKN